MKNLRSLAVALSCRWQLLASCSDSWNTALSLKDLMDDCALAGAQAKAAGDATLESACVEIYLRSCRRLGAVLVALGVSLDDDDSETETPASDETAAEAWAREKNEGLAAWLEAGQ